MSKVTPGWRTALFITVLYGLFFPVYWGLYAWDADWHFRWFQGEDKVIEWITFFGFLTAGVLALRFFRYWPVMPPSTRIFFIGLGLFFVICAGEEISWGQRLLGFETPEALADINTQNEFNVHNIEFEHFHPKDVVSWSLKLWGLFIPLGLLVVRGHFAWLRSILSPAAMIPCYAIPELINLAEEALAHLYGSRYGEAAAEMVHTQLEEWMEMYWGLGVLFSVLALRDLWRGRLASNPEQTGKQAQQQQDQEPA